MTREDIIEQLNLAIGLIKQDGKDWLDDRDIPMLEECVKVLSQEPTVDVLEQIRAEIERLHYHPKLDFIKNDEVVDMALDIIDKQIGAIRNERL